MLKCLSERREAPLVRLGPALIKPGWCARLVCDGKRAQRLRVVNRCSKLQDGVYVQNRPPNLADDELAQTLEVRSKLVRRLRWLLVGNLTCEPLGEVLESPIPAREEVDPGDRRDVKVRWDSLDSDGDDRLLQKNGVFNLAPNERRGSFARPRDAHDDMRGVLDRVFDRGREVLALIEVALVVPS